MGKQVPRVSRISDEKKKDILKKQSAEMLGVAPEELVWNEIPKITVDGKIRKWEPEDGRCVKSFQDLYQLRAHLGNNIPNLKIVPDLRRDFEYVTLCLKQHKKNKPSFLNDNYAMRYRYHYEQNAKLIRKIALECIGFKTLGKGWDRDEREYCDTRQGVKKLGLAHALDGLKKTHGDELVPAIRDAPPGSFSVPALAIVTRAGFCGTHLIESHNSVVAKDFSLDSCAFMNPYTLKNGEMPITGIRNECEGEAAGIFSIGEELPDHIKEEITNLSLAEIWNPIDQSLIPSIIDMNLSKVEDCMKSVHETTSHKIIMPLTGLIRPNRFADKDMMIAIDNAMNAMISPTEMHDGVIPTGDHIIHPFLEMDIAA